MLDLKSVTVQLSLLADSLVQVCLSILNPEIKPTESGFAVIAMGKLGGAELNYSSDIDLIFLCREDASRFWSLGQRLIKALTDSTGEGFLYRVDMRLGRGAVRGRSSTRSTATSPISKRTACCGSGKRCSKPA